MENFKVEYKHKKGVTEAVFSGQLNVVNIEKIVENVRANIRKGNPLVITTKEVEALDITFVQMIYSLVKSGKNEGFEVRTAIEIPKELEQLLNNAGFSGQIIENK